MAGHPSNEIVDRRGWNLGGGRERQKERERERRGRRGWAAKRVERRNKEDCFPFFPSPPLSFLYFSPIHFLLCVLLPAWPLSLAHHRRGMAGHNAPRSPVTFSVSVISRGFQSGERTIENAHKQHAASAHRQLLSTRFQARAKAH